MGFQKQLWHLLLLLLNSFLNIIFNIWIISVPARMNTTVFSRCLKHSICPNLCATMDIMWTKGPSLPTESPEPMASTVPTALATRVLYDKTSDDIDVVPCPDKSTFICGIPDPLATLDNAWLTKEDDNDNDMHHMHHIKNPIKREGRYVSRFWRSCKTNVALASKRALKII